jgi:hypothetical protein
VEQDPLVIWESVRTAIRQTMEQAEAEHGEVVVKAVGITNQRECRPTILSPELVPALSAQKLFRSACVRFSWPSSQPRLPSPTSAPPTVGGDNFQSPAEGRPGRWLQVRRQWSGTEPPASRCTTPLCGWTTAPRASATKWRSALAAGTISARYALPAGTAPACSTLSTDGPVGRPPLVS